VGIVANTLEAPRDDVERGALLSIDEGGTRVRMLLHPRMADVYREKVASLCRRLENEENRTGAVEAIRALIETIVLEPDGDQLKITLKGDLAGMLRAARDSKRSPETGDLLLQIQLVAGARNHLYLEFAWAAA
jgi:hypothetical protein